MASKRDFYLPGMTLLLVVAMSSCVVANEIVATQLDSHPDDSDSEGHVEDKSVATDVPLRVLKPTNEWQTVEEDMAIPPGLHVRMDLQTGKKEAKLLDPSESTAAASSEQDSSVTNIEVPRDLRPGIVNTKRMAFTQEQLKEAEVAAAEEDGATASSNGGERPAIAYEPSNDDVHVTTAEEIARKYAASRQKIRSMEMRADVEVMQDIVAILKNSSASELQKLRALEELEYYVHQIDNARDLEVIGGMEPLLRALEDGSNEMRSLAILTLGSAMQGNPDVQKTVLKYNVLPTLLQLLRSSEKPIAIRRRSIFALSSLVRSHPEAQRLLWNQGGLRVLKDLCQLSLPDPGPALCVKAVTLVSDIIVEEVSGELPDGQPKVLPQLEGSGWCDVVGNLLSSQDNDVLEKGIAALQSLVPACGNSLSQQSHVYQQLSSLHEHLQEQSMNNDDDQDQYFANMQEQVRAVRLELSRCALHSNCSVSSPGSTPPHTEL